MGTQTMITRLFKGVRNHFNSRFWEWLFAGMLGWAGVVTIQADDEFLFSATYGVMRNVARQDLWGVLFLLVAGIRIVTLTLNGTFKPFRRFSPIVRSVVAGVSGLAWAAIAMGLWQGSSIYIGAGSYFGLMVGEFFLLSEILEEVGETERDYRNGTA